jgi:NitT/TauT family transport system substrate-binding protein
MAAETDSLKKVRVSMMNAVHDMPVLVARDDSFFRDEGLDVEIVKTPGSGQYASDHQALKPNIFERTMEALYDGGQCDQFRMCEWGVMKRAVESLSESGHRPAKIVALGSAMSSFAIVTDPKMRIYEPEQLKNKPIAVSPFNGSHFTTLKLLEGFLSREQIKTTFAGTMRERIETLRRGEVAAASLMEPWISVAEKQGLRVLMESHSTRSEAAGDELDGPTLAKMFRAEARAAEAIDKNPERYAHYLIEEAGGLLEAKDIKLSRLLNAPPQEYTHERFDHTYNWTLGWGLVPPGATFENTVDNRAWR